MSRRRQARVLVGLIATVMLVTVPAATAWADARVRVVNASGGSDGVSVVVDVGGNKTPIGNSVPFGQASEFVSTPAGQAQFSVQGGKGSASETLTDGASYTVIALPKDALQVLENGKARARVSRLRVVHAAPELGEPDIRIGKRTIAQGVAFKTATKYLTFDPGAYELAVTKPNGGATVFSKQISLSAGSAMTVVIAGSGGSAAQAIAVDDATVTPAGAPHTGLGGLARGGGAHWLLALLAALVAGTLGGGTQLRRARRTKP